MSKKSQGKTMPDLGLQWETGALGQDEAFAKVSSQSTEQSISEALNLELVSVRLEKELIEDLKMITEQEGMSFQALIRHTLANFIDSKNSDKE